MRRKQILFIFALLCAVAQGAWAADRNYEYPTKTKPSFYKSYGGKSNVVVINTEAELAYITANFSEDSDFDVDDDDWSELNYYLNADLDMGTQYSWLPLGRESYYVTKFEGTFWGNGHTIKFKTWDLDEENQALFSTIHMDGKVYDVNVVCDIDTKRDYAGGICGENWGTIGNCTVTANIVSTDHDYVGGICGKNSNHGTVTGCRVMGTIKGKGSAKYVGGITGQNIADIKNCWVSADVSSEHYNALTSAYVGGICGDNTDNTITFCCMTGNVSNPKNDYVGGMIGFTKGSGSGFKNNPASTKSPSRPRRTFVGGQYGSPNATNQNFTFYGTITNNHSRSSDVFGEGGGDEIHESFTDSELATYLASFSGNDLYRYAVKYPFAINVTTEGYGTIEASAGGETGITRWRPGQTVTLTVKRGRVASVTVTDASGNNVFVSSNATDGYTFTMPKKDVSVKVVFAAVDWDDESLGTEDNPYYIDGPSDWSKFAERVNNGKSFSGKHIKLTDNISVTQKVGTVSGSTLQNAFSGIFDGNGKTITATIEDTSNQGTALFSYINGATIKNLNVAGEISGAVHAAALVGFSKGSNNVIQNCKVSAKVSGGSHIAGILGHGLDSDITISGCVYSGNLWGGGTAKGVFFGWGDDGGTKRVTDCLYLPDIYQIYLHLDLVCMSAGSVTVTNSYKTCEKGTYGCQVFSAVPTGDIYKPVTAADGNTYYMLCSVSGVNDKYDYTGNAISIVPTLTAADGTVLTASDYTYAINPVTVQAKGDYTLTVNGTGSYQGTKTLPFVVKDLSKIDSSSDLLETGEYNLSTDVTINSRITISGNVVLNLGEGATLTAPKGIELAHGNTLTINGPGALTINGCSDQKSGIGAEQVGTLVINGGIINVTGGRNAAAIGGDENDHTHGGNITINGGVVSATGGAYGAGIGGGYSYFASTGICGSIVINGGQVTATGGTNAPGIGPGAISAGSNGNSGSLTLGWTNTTDYICISSFTNNSGMTLSSISFADGKEFVLEESPTTTATTSNISGQKIIPYYLKLAGDGSTTSPYLIESADDWNTFCNYVATGVAFNGKTLKLTQDISVTTMVGVDINNVFRGTFDGGGHTLTVSIGTAEEPFAERFCGPFRYTYGATIKNLRTTGHIYTADINAGGVVGRNGTASLTLQNVSSSVAIHSTVSGSGYHGGLVGYTINASLSGCVFTGSLLGVESHHIGGLLGQKSDTGDSNATFTNCLFAPAEVAVQSGMSHPFASGAVALVTIGSGCYYTTLMGSSQGTQVFAAATEGEISKQVTAADGNNYYIGCTVSGVQAGYKYTGGDIAVAAPTVTAADGTVLTAGTDFTFSPATVQATGDYTLTVSGKGNYSGAKEYKLVVGEYTPVASTTTAMTTDSYKVYNDVTISQRITISGDVVLYLGEGATLRARKGIELTAGNSLTVNGPGALVIDKCDSGKSGIGAETAGTLTIQGGQIDITGAEGAAGIGSDAGKAASGTLTLAWTDASDNVKCSSYAVENFEFAKQFVLEDEEAIATTSNIAGELIVPAVVLSDAGDNSDILEANHDAEVAVALDGRTLYLDGDWNTICLPFDQSISDVKGAEARTVTEARIDGTTLHLTFGNPVDVMEAGTPYIIKFAKDDDYVDDDAHNYLNPVFYGVTIDATANHDYDNGQSGDLRVRFLGTYAKKPFDGEDKSILMMGAANTLYYPLANASIGACRAYFKIGEDGAPARQLAAFRISFGEGETTGVIGVNEVIEVSDDSWYSLDGRRLSQQPSQRGIYINNGKKTVIK